MVLERPGRTKLTQYIAAYEVTTMKKILLAMALLTPQLAFAVDGNVLFSGTVSSACSFNSASPGTLTVTGTSISSASPGTINVLNNDPGAFTLTLGSTALTTSPDGQTISAITVTPTVTGSNAGITLPATLDNSGTDTVSVALTSGTLDATATAGNYIVNQVISCISL